MTIQRYKNSDICKQNVCLSEITAAIERRQTRALSAYYLLKQSYKNSCLYNFRARMPHLAAVVGVSQRTLYNYFAYLKRRGLIRAQGDHLMLISTKKAKEAHRERKKYQITISDNETIQTIEARLMGKAVEQHMGRMAWHKRVKRYERRYTRRRNVTINDNNERGAGYSLSIRNVMRLLNVGQNKAVQTICLLNGLGVIYTAENLPRVLGAGHKRAVKLVEDLPGHFFVLNGVLYQQFGNKHTPLEHPPNEKPLTYKQYVSIYNSYVCKKQYDTINVY